MREALSHRLEPSWVRRQALLWRVRTSDALSRLERLRRLTVRARDGGMGGYTETSVEQSWNEQIFGVVFGYQTMLSHDGACFHLLPKNYLGSRRYDDFSLGWFGVDGARRIVTGEVKGPGVNLDVPSGPNGSPVEQVLSAARTDGTRYAVVSNFTELRLYAVADALRPLAVAHLDAVGSVDQLASVAGIFGITSLIGATMTSTPDIEGMSATHPSAPIATSRPTLLIRYAQGHPFPRYNAQIARALEYVSSPWAPQAYVEQREGWIVVEQAAPAVGLAPAPTSKIAVHPSGELVYSTLVESGLLTHGPTEYVRIAIPPMERAIGKSLDIQYWLNGRKHQDASAELSLENVQDTIVFEEAYGGGLGICPAPTSMATMKSVSSDHGAWAIADLLMAYVHKKRHVQVGVENITKAIQAARLDRELTG